MNDRQTRLGQTPAQHLADFIAAIRTDWDAPGIHRALGNATNRPDRPDAWQIALAAIRAASDPTNRTPAVIALDGRHWRPAAPDATDTLPTPTPTSVADLRCRRCQRWITEPDHTCQPVGDYTAGVTAAKAAMRREPA